LIINLLSITCGCLVALTLSVFYLAAFSDKMVLNVPSPLLKPIQPAKGARPKIPLFLLLFTLRLPIHMVHGGCSDTNNGALDVVDDNCDGYNNNNYCDLYDDDDFSSVEMCCACGGGLTSYSKVCAIGSQPTVSDSACEMCPYAKFSDSTSNSLCTDCGSGEHTIETGSESRASCLTCGPGYHSETGSCVICPLGHYSTNDKNAECKICEIGKFNNMTGADSADSLHDLPYRYQQLPWILSMLPASSRVRTSRSP